MSEDQYPDGRPERPRVEPEIIPPGGRGPREANASRGEGAPEGIFLHIDERGGTRRIFVAQPGPLAVFLALVLIALIVALIVLVLLGVVLLWIPVAIVIVIAFVSSFYLRAYWRRLRNWLARR